MAAQERIGRKRLVVGAHYGTADFIIQRMTAVIMAAYTLILLIGYLFTPEMGFEGWRNLFLFTWGAVPVGQMLATLAAISVAWHAWVGIVTIFMDYVKPAGLRLAVEVLAALWLVGSLVYFAKVLWSL